MRSLAVGALCFLALLSLSSTWALQGGSISQGPAVSVTTTGNALLALEPGSTTAGGNAAGVAYLTSSGDLRLDFTRGYLLNEQYGFQATQPAGYNSTFTYRGLFHILNNSNENLKTCVYVPDAVPGANDISGIFVRAWSDTTGPGTQVAGSAGQKMACSTTWLAPGARQYVDVAWSMRGASTNLGTYQFNIRVEGQR